MKISTKGRYGLEALLDLAIHSQNDYISIKSISERQNISDNYLEQLFGALKRSDIVESIRGAQGGYRLSRDAGQITVRQILNALEGPLALVDCIIEDESDRCDKFACCVTRVLWQRLMESLNSLTDGITLADLVSSHKRLNEAKAGEYYI